MFVQGAAAAQIPPDVPVDAPSAGSKLAAQLGTAFLRSSECGASRTGKDALGRAGDGDTRVTRVFSGRHMRGLDSELRRVLEPYADTLPRFPVQLALTAEIRAAASKAGNAKDISPGSGQAVALGREESAATIMARVASEMATAAKRTNRARA